MKKTLQCVLFLMLAVLTLFAVTALGASAASGDAVKVEYTKDGAPVTEYYASISAAITGMGDAIADGATVTVLGDIAADGAAAISAGEVVINGNGYTVKGLSLNVSGGSLTMNGGNYITSGGFISATDGAIVTVYGGYFENSSGDLLTVASGAKLAVYGGYFYRPTGDGYGFVRVNGAGVANIYGGTYVADYTDTGYVFATADATAALTYYAFNGSGSAAIVYNAATDTAVMQQDATYTFCYNSVKVFSTVSLRLGDSVAKSGLRFTSYISKGFIEMVESLKDADTAVSYGTVVIPTKYLDGVNCFSIESAKKALVIPATSAGMKADEANGGIFIRASIYNLPHVANGSSMLYADDYAVTAYAEYVKDGKTVRHYANYEEELHTANMASLAGNALQDVSETLKGAYVNELVVNGSVVYSKYTDAERELMTNASTADASAQGLEMTFHEETSTYSVTGYTGAGAKIIIPATYLGYPVTAIGDYAFWCCSSLTSIAIPASVTSIGSSAFSGCSSLTEITIPAGVTCIDTCVFSDCSNLQTVTFAEGIQLTSIGSSAFAGCNSLTSIAIPASVTSIGENAFYNCSSLEKVIISDIAAWCSISFNDLVANPLRNAQHLYLGENEITKFVIPENVTSIGWGAFAGCSLTSITIPASVTSIAENAFFDCVKLIEVYNLSSLNITAGSWSNGYVGYYAKNVYTSTSVESNLFTTDDGYIFYDNGINRYLMGYTGNSTELTLPSNCNGNNYQIYGYAFYNCKSFTSITIPASITSIDGRAFSGCSSLETVNFANGSKLTSIGDYAFHGCSSLTSVTIPASVTSIGSSAFYYCSSLKAVTFADGSQLTSIGNYAFELCNNLESIMIPEGVTSIGTYAFYNCSNLISVTIPANVTSISRAFSGCSSLKTVTFANNSQLASISTHTFYNCSSLTSITIPSSVTSIGNAAFYGCSSLTEITIPERVINIYDYAFDGCKKLTEINIPANVTSIGKYAFYNCSNLTSINYQGTVAEWQAISMGADWSYNTGAYTITCTDGTIAKDGTVTMNPVFTPGLVFELIDGTYTVTGYTGTSTEVLIPATYQGVAVTAIGDTAFFYCSKLTTITIPAGVTSIGTQAFCSCSNLTSITIPASVISIGDDAFYDCKSLKTVTFAEGSKLTAIGIMAFHDCSSLTSITIPAGVTGIGSDAFSGCSNLSSIALPAGVTVIDARVFSGCTNLTTITIPTGVTGIGGDAFADCSSLTSITIPASVTDIGNYAFWDCGSLTKITYQGTVAEWQTINKGFDWNYGTGAYTITCTDGTIAKDGTVTMN